MNRRPGAAGGGLAAGGSAAAAAPQVAMAAGFRQSARRLVEQLYSHYKALVAAAKARSMRAGEGCGRVGVGWLCG